MNKVTKKTPGRPTKITDDTIQKLEHALASGVTAEMACRIAGISKSTYYEHIEKDETFSDKMQRAREWPEMKARNNVVGAIEKGDVNTSKWYLERKARKEFSAKLEVDGEIEHNVEFINLVRGKEIADGN